MWFSVSANLKPYCAVQRRDGRGNRHDAVRPDCAAVCGGIETAKYTLRLRAVRAGPRPGGTCRSPGW
eukprot:1378026-Prymnesium_polylepis.1